MNNSSLVSAPVQRLLSLDVLRGVTIAFMIMVNNNGGSGSWNFMNHSKWNGFTPTDLVFPAFVFVVGASIAYAFDARLARGATRAQLARHTVQRAATLFLLGIVVNGFPFFALAHLRIYGVPRRHLQIVKSRINGQRIPGPSFDPRSPKMAYASAPITICRYRDIFLLFGATEPCDQNSSSGYIQGLRSIAIRHLYRVQIGSCHEVTRPLPLAQLDESEKPSHHIQ